MSLTEGFAASRAARHAMRLAGLSISPSPPPPPSQAWLLTLVKHPHRRWRLAMLDGALHPRPAPRELQRIRSTQLATSQDDLSLMHNPSPTHPGPRPFVDPSFDNGQLAYGIGNHQGQQPRKFFVPERPEVRLRLDLPRFYPASPGRTQSFDVTDLGHSTVSRPATHPLAVASWPLTLLFPAG
ncbi:hypothetical protein BGZ61DRAFT_191838 [Ilyonectria robusta]|uniref:uncharacterized protein n=1 Tax=Ilyonectria robusta TaxID=1079257 RepID=UPI001E8D6E62|nr:uncharacterized protein BGZ61DRAFT_191838 [Ilyonectria robusta]KAH8655951.1 hypothetical protein BGZ61DRAFT_191838 [Ilyonectria robusta]